MNIPFSDYYLAAPYYLLLLLLPVLYLFYRKRKRKVYYTLSTTLGFQVAAMSWKAKARPYLDYLLGLAAFFMIIALARPQDTGEAESIQTEGIDIILSLDVSPSMDVNDLLPTRLEAAKEVATKFVMGRPSDRIGLVIFAGESFTQCPATIDHNVLVAQIDGLHSNLLTKSTAIGMGLASAVNNLRSSNAASKVVILMTDGINEGGVIAPETALAIAKMYGVRVYTIGVGSDGDVFVPITDELGNVISRQKLKVAIDEVLLQKIADETGGKYYRATDNASLSKIYEAIDQLEKSKIEGGTFTHYKECYRPFLFVALLLLMLHVIASMTVFRSLT